MASLTLLLLCSPYAAFAATTSGSFSLLSYNVAGLPELLSSGDPAVNTPLISPRLTAFNVINVQEDFNYHAALYADDDHPFRTPTSGGALIGSGLNSLSDYSYVDFERHGWDDCNLNSGDCLTPKGFTYMRVRASEGMFFDLYNLHTDAGSDDADRSARAANLAQLVAHIGKWSAGVPVVIMGDTNARYSNNVDGASLRNLISSTGVADAWVSNVRGGSAPAAGTDALVCPFPFASGATQATLVSCEVVDKIFVRSGRSAELSTTAYTNENGAFVNASGAPLSDHYPISADASWKLSSSLRMADSIGGPHGDPFNDLSTSLASTVPKITSFTIRAGERVDGLSYALSSSATVAHGGSGGTARTLSLSNGQYINSITICSGQKDDRTRVFYIKVTTNTGSTLEGGSTTGSCISQSVPSDPGSGGAWGLVGFWGRSGNEVDRLAPIWGSVY